jgi:hypothetical protein
MTNAAFSACYSDWKLIRTRKTVQIVLEIPVEKSNEAYSALGGMPDSGAEVWVAVARLDTSKIKSGESAPDREADGQLGRSPVSRSHKPVAPDRRLAQRAGILSAEPLFHRYLEEVSKMEKIEEADAATYIRTKCGVESRKDIIPGTDAAIEFDKICCAFTIWRDADQYVEAAE